MPRVLVMFFFFAFGGVVLAQDTDKRIVPRSFPTTLVTLGDVPLAIPQQWLTNKALKVSSGRQRYVYFVNADQPQFPSTEHLQIPPLALFVLTQVPAELSESNLRQQRAELEKRWSNREPDDHGFWHWKTDEFVSVTDASHRPLGQPLIVNCRNATPQPEHPVRDRCSVWFYWTPFVSVRYDFMKTKFPEAEWSRLDRRVLDFLRFLDARGAVGTDR